MVASLAEVNAVVRVINAAYEVEKFFVSGDRTDADAVTRLMTQGAFLMTRDDRGGVSGCVYVELRGDRCYFGMLSVDPACQGTGLGRRLVEDAEDYACDHGCRFMDIRVVNLRTELLPFYRNLGYEAHGREPVDDPRALQPFHFVLMSKTLA